MIGVYSTSVLRDGGWMQCKTGMERTFSKKDEEDLDILSRLSMVPFSFRTLFLP